MSVKKIYAMYPSIENIDRALRWLGMRDLDFVKDLNFVWDENEPDYIVASDKIYTSPEYAQKFLELVNNNPDSIIIFRTGEAILPDFNIFDYAVTPNYDFSFMDRSARCVYRLGGYSTEKANTLTFDSAKSLIAGKKRFCNFLYSNGRAHPYRDNLFHAVSEYKRVDSLGPHLNNVNTLITRNGGGGG